MDPSNTATIPPPPSPETNQVERMRCIDEFLKEMSDETLELRKSDPWVRGMPIDRLLTCHFETMATSAKTPPYRLVFIARKILEYIAEARTIAACNLRKINDFAEKQEKLLEISESELMRVFSSLFKRILSTKFETEDADEVKKFYDFVWSIHVQGKIDFSDWAVIHLLIEKFPRYLEDELLKALKLWQPGLLAPLCVKHSHTFQILFSFLRQIYDHCNRHSRIMEFTCSFLKFVELLVVPEPLNEGEIDLEMTRRRYTKLVEMYSVPFHPILYFLAEVKVNGLVDRRISTENSIIQDEILDLVNGLFSAYPQDTKMIIFFLASNETIPRIIHAADSVGAVTLHRHPHLWKTLHKTG